MNPGADHENMTVMAACSASGRFLPPMIIFPGQHVQSTWKPTTLATSENYPWIYVNKKGWMDGPTFFKWFQEFEEKTRSYEEVSFLISVI